MTLRRCLEEISHAVPVDDPTNVASLRYIIADGAGEFSAVSGEAKKQSEVTTGRFSSRHNMVGIQVKIGCVGAKPSDRCFTVVQLHWEAYLAA